MADLLSDEPFPREVLADCVRREVAKRKYVYKRLVGEQKLTQAKADREIAMMEEVAKILEKQT